jgi:hypothetical protein
MCHQIFGSFGILPQEVEGTDTSDTKSSTNLSKVYS